MTPRSRMLAVIRGAWETSYPAIVRAIRGFGKL